MDTSSNTGAHKVQLVATQDSLVIVATYDWSTFLGHHFKKIPNIKKFHHIRFSKNEQGIVNCREYLSYPVQDIFLLRNGIAIPPVSVRLQKINLDRRFKRGMLNLLISRKKTALQAWNDLATPVL